MASSLDSHSVAQIMLSWLDLELVACEELQTLWAGYGHICAIEARAKTPEIASSFRSRHGINEYAASGNFRLVLKVISPPGQQEDEGHLRKMLSYEVEQYFYDAIGPQLDKDIAIAKCLASTRSMKKEALLYGLQGLTATLMTDLRPDFPVAGEKRAVLSTTQVDAALVWLAKFHRSSWKSLPCQLSDFLLPPCDETKRRLDPAQGGGTRLWLNGGYTYLATRQQEYSLLKSEEGSEWSAAFCTLVPNSSMSIAEMVATFLTPSGRPIETFIHGDVKSENLFTTRAGDQVAFFDFQYAGIGLGVCDLAKLFTCSLPLCMITSSTGTVGEELPMSDREEQLLERYRQVLLGGQQEGKTVDYPWIDFSRHWELALVDWCRFQASWGFWGNTEWLQARVRHILKNQGWRDWLQAEFTKG